MVLQTSMQVSNDRTSSTTVVSPAIFTLSSGPLSTVQTKILTPSSSIQIVYPSILPSVSESDNSISTTKSVHQAISSIYHSSSLQSIDHRNIPSSTAALANSTDIIPEKTSKIEYLHSSSYTMSKILLSNSVSIVESSIATSVILSTPIIVVNQDSSSVNQNLIFPTTKTGVVVAQTKSYPESVMPSGSIRHTTAVLVSPSSSAWHSSSVVVSQPTVLPGAKSSDDGMDLNLILIIVASTAAFLVLVLLCCLCCQRKRLIIFLLRFIHINSLPFLY